MPAEIVCLPGKVEIEKTLPTGRPKKGGNLFNKQLSHALAVHIEKVETGEKKRSLFGCRAKSEVARVWRPKESGEPLRWADPLLFPTGHSEEVQGVVPVTSLSHIGQV